jgi:predicted acylesterase/phospholipase RssA
VTAAASNAAAPLDPNLYGVIRRLAEDPDGRFVVALGSGALPAIAGNLALVSILDDLGLKGRVAEVWGVSAGAVVGGAWTSGVEPAAILEGLLALRGRGAVDVAWKEILRGLFRALRGGPLPSGLVSGRVFSETLKASLRVETIEACSPPFRCVAAVDDGLGRKRIFRRGPLHPAILRSMSIPGVFLPPPPDADGTEFVDGAVVESTPLASPIDEHRRLHPKKSLTILASRFRRDPATPTSRSFLSRMLRSMQALQAQLWERQLAEARAVPNATILVVETRVDDPELFDFERFRAHVDAAKSRMAEDLCDARVATLLSGA